MKKKITIGIIVLLVIVGIFYFKNSKKSDAVKEYVYRTAEVETHTIHKKILATGSLGAFTRVELKSTSSGRIEKIFVQEGDIVKKGQSLATISTDARNTLIDAANAQLKIAISGNDQQEIKDAREALEIAKEAYKPMYITSTIDGEIINRTSEEGQNVTVSTTLFVISDRLIARVDVDEVDIAKIKTGMKAIIRLDSYIDEEVMAVVKKISREGETISDVVVYEIIIEPENVPSYWASGMTANVDFLVETEEDVIAVPQSALKSEKAPKNGKEKNYVEVLEDGKPVKKYVKTGLSDGKYTYITEGIEIGENVITLKEEKKDGDEQNSIFNAMNGRKRRSK